MLLTVYFPFFADIQKKMVYPVYFLNVVMPSVYDMERIWPYLFIHRIRLQVERYHSSYDAKLGHYHIYDICFSIRYAS